MAIPVQPILNFNASISGTMVTFTWTYNSKQASFLSSTTGTISVRRLNGDSVFRTFSVNLTTGRLQIPSVPYGVWWRGVLTYSTSPGRNTNLLSGAFGINPFTVSVTNVTQTSAVLRITGEPNPTIPNSNFLVYKVSDNSVAYTGPMGPFTIGRTETVNGLQPGTQYRAQFRNMINIFTTVSPPVLPVCTGTPTNTANAGTVTKKTGQTIPGISGTFDVYDATTFCPAFYSSGGYTYQLPNNGNYVVFGLQIDGTRKPSFYDVNQGGIGDCVLDSIMASAAHKNPDYIKSGIVQDPTALHTFFVRLHYKKITNPFWVRLTAMLPLVDSITSYDRFYLTNENGISLPVIWSHLIMKAYCCMNNIFPDFMLHFGVGYNCLDGVDTTDAMRAIFGEAQNVEPVFCNHDFVCFSDASIASYKTQLDSLNVKNLMNSPDVIFTCGVDPNDMKTRLCSSYPGSNRYRVTNWNGIEIVQILNANGSIKQCFISYHAYSIMELRTSDNKVIIRNPWGGYQTCFNSLPPGGLIAVDYEDFVKCFNIYFTKRSSTPTMSGTQSFPSSYLP